MHINLNDSMRWVGAAAISARRTLGLAKSITLFQFQLQGGY